ncbi:helix-turn-helix domain-containing protein [Halobacillus salinarum]|uniref:Helix-turn-helix domain-containing protein n=1 Tax=Halobacillus salinarum TaxID=2932257 RepID=A0ABY4EKT3_9BACI|nr:helix-turn-helix domain-containing protein [Halobacillus salinarum]UOQ45082.1 helix-turn-helix domain-containing protein [Halobacillus salinarum]
MELGHLIHYFRRKSDLTLEQLADQICSITYLSQIENGKRMPREDVLAKLCTRLGLEIHRIFQADSLLLRKELFSFYSFTQQRNELEADRMYHQLKTEFSEAELSYHMEIYFELFSLYYFFFKREIELYQRQLHELDPMKTLMNEEQRYYFELIKGTAALSFFQAEEAIHAFHAALSFEGPKKQGDLRYKLAIAYSRHNKLIHSNSYAEQAVILFQDQLEYRRIMDCYMILGINYNLLGEYELSKDYFQKMMDRPFEDIDISFKGMLYHNFGYLLYNQQHYDQALLYLQKAIDILSDSASTQLGSLFLMSKSHMAMNNSESARISIKKGKELAEKNENKEYLLKFEYLSCQLREADHHEIEVLLKDHILPYFSKYGDKDDLHFYIKKLADLYYEEHKYKSASDYYKQIIS